MMYSMIRDELIKVIGNFFKIDTNIITDDFGPKDIKNWDSLNHLKLCIEIEKNFKIRFEQEDIESLISFKIIYKTVKMYISEN